MEAQGHLRASFWINANCRYSFELPTLSTPLRNCLVPARPRKVSSRLMAEPKSMMLMLPLQRHFGKHLTLARSNEQKTKSGKHSWAQAIYWPERLLTGLLHTHQRHPDILKKRSSLSPVPRMGCREVLGTAEHHVATLPRRQGRCKDRRRHISSNPWDAGRSV